MENKDPRMHRKTIDGITAFEEENVQDSNPFAPLKPLDEALLKARIQTLFEERNAHLKKLLEDLSSTVTEIVNMLQQLTTVHDELILDAYNSEIQCIQQMEVSQACLILKNA
ncbi:hypothetical protein EC973_004336 [Apophysomyces ossiformis]|uniref:Uncharacterized protein n=1 Tax=Apophysomyces ossiformis TaxID=679940 RepID=A0A8H7ELH9_9FUNG|nr:hypothetical protein EC973_004336 [Apophysomyces ossiformis]